MNFIGDVQLLSLHVTFTDKKSLAELDDESWKPFLLENLNFTTKDCNLLVHRLCAILVDESSLPHYIKFINDQTLSSDAFQVVLDICARCKSKLLLQVLIDKCQSEDDLLAVYDLVKSAGITDIINLIAKAKTLKLLNLGFESSLYYLSFNSDQEIAQDALRIGLFHPEIMNLQVLNDLKVANDNNLVELLDHFKNGSKTQVEKWIRDDSKYKAFYDSKNLIRKVELYTLTNLCKNNLSKSISYQEISKTCEISISEVEKLIIDGVRSNLVSGKMSQGVSFYVSKVAPLVIEDESVEILKQRIEKIKEALRSNV